MDNKFHWWHPLAANSFLKKAQRNRRSRKMPMQMEKGSKKQFVKTKIGEWKWTFQKLCTKL